MLPYKVVLGVGIPIEALHNSSKKAFCLPLLDGYLKLVKWSSGQRQGEQILTRRPKGGASQSWWTFWGHILDVYSFFFFFGGSLVDYMI